MQLLLSSEGALPALHRRHRPPVLETWRAGHGLQRVPLLCVPDGHTVQLLLSSVRWPRDGSQSLHSEEPYGAYCAGPQSSHSPVRMLWPGSHLMQLLLSSDGALPSSHSEQRPPAFET